MFFYSCPKEIANYAMTYLSVKELGTLASVSKASKMLSEEDQLWKGLLGKDFNLTEDQLHIITDRVKKSYKNIYQSYKYFSINSYQSSAIEKLSIEGLTKQHFFLRDWFNDHEAIMVLEKLVRRDKLSVEDALNGLEKLEDFQRNAVYSGVNLEAAKQLTKIQFKFIKSCFKMIYDTHFEIPGDVITMMLLEKIQGQTWFNSEHHSNTFFHLLAQPTMNLSKAFEEIRDFDENQVQLIQQGFSRQQVLDFKPTLNNRM